MLTKIWRHIRSPKYFPLFTTVIMIGFATLFTTILTTDRALTVNQEVLTIHQEPSTKSKIISKVEKNRRVHILDQKNQWYYVRVDNYSQGWVPQWLLEGKHLLQEDNLFVHVTKDTPLYQTSDKQSKTDHQIKADTYLSIQEVTRDWIKVAYQDKTGFVPLENVNILIHEDLPEDLHDDKNNRVGDIELKKKTDNTVYVRSNQAYYVDAPSYYANTIYEPTYNQAFEFIHSTNDENGEEFYLVEDSEGVRGYLNSRIVAFAKDYEGHQDQTSAKSLEEATILIDPGHGGEDNGASSLDGIHLEKDATLPTAMKIKEILEDKGATVHITRSSDTWVDLSDRVDQSNTLKVDAFLSIHYDASPDSTWYGSTTYYFHEGDYNLANYVNQELSNLPVDNNGTLFGNFQVIRDNDYPALLLELGFITNDHDLEYILQEDYHEEIANNIAKGLEKYFSDRR